MCTKLLKDSRLFQFIQTIDEDAITQCRASGCDCGGKIDRSYFPKKPRPAMPEFDELFARRPSFCCRRDNCRKRVTPPQLKFLRRKVYLSVVVLLVAAMTQGSTPNRLCELKREVGVSAQTVRRWLVFWRKIFTATASWEYQRGNFVPAVDETGLPLSLLERLASGADPCRDRIIALLRLAVV